MDGLFWLPKSNQALGAANASREDSLSCIGHSTPCQSRTLPQSKVVSLHRKLISLAPFYCWVWQDPSGQGSAAERHPARCARVDLSQDVSQEGPPARALSSRQSGELNFNHLALLFPDGRVPFLRFTDITTGLGIPIVLVAVLFCPLFFTYSPCFEHNCSGTRLELQELRRSQLPPDQGHQHVSSD